MPPSAKMPPGANSFLTPPAVTDSQICSIKTIYELIPQHFRQHEPHLHNKFHTLPPVWGVLIWVCMQVGQSASKLYKIFCAYCLQDVGMVWSSTGSMEMSITGFLSIDSVVQAKHIMRKIKVTHQGSTELTLWCILELTHHKTVPDGGKVSCLCQRLSC